MKRGEVGRTHIRPEQGGRHACSGDQFFLLIVYSWLIESDIRSVTL